VDGGVWYTAQGSGDLGWLDPGTGETRHVPLGPGSRPHGVVVDGEGTPWVTDSGRLDAIVAVDPDTDDVKLYRLPNDVGPANLNTVTFDDAGLLWFTGQEGILGSLDPDTEEMAVFDAPGGGATIAATPDGTFVGCPLAGFTSEPSATTTVTVRALHQDKARAWLTRRFVMSEGPSRHQPQSGSGDSPPPGEDPALRVHVDDQDIVWERHRGHHGPV
jgi:virginiamycin B lyase